MPIDKKLIVHVLIRAVLLFFLTHPAAQCLSYLHPETFIDLAGAIYFHWHLSEKLTQTGWHWTAALVLCGSIRPFRIDDNNMPIFFFCLLPIMSTNSPVPWVGAPLKSG